MNNYVSLTGSLLAPAKVINHGPHQFIYAQLIVDTGYFNSSNKFQKHQECVPLRFNMSMSRVLLLKSSDTLQIAGRIIRFVGEDDTDPTKAMSYYYIQVQNCGLMCQHRFKIVRNHRFKNVLFHRFKCCFVCCSV